MKKLLIYMAAAFMVASCSSVRKTQSVGGEVTGVGAPTFSEPTPYGMVYIDCGSM